ncbi:VCBS repeat-containing protein [bacterium]|nr:VCBS repeat-containing protein [bacterium]
MAVGTGKNRWRIWLELLLIAAAVGLLAMFMLQRLNTSSTAEDTGDRPDGDGIPAQRTHRFTAEELPQRLATATEKLRSGMNLGVGATQQWYMNGGPEEAAKERRQEEMEFQADLLWQQYPELMEQLTSDFSSEDFVNYARELNRRADSPRNVVDCISELVQEHSDDYELIYREIEGKVRDQRELLVRSAAVTRGSAITWQALYEFQSTEEFGKNLSSGNFEGGADRDELLVEYDYSRLAIVGQDGAVRRLDWTADAQHLFSFQGIPYDFDEDGQLELVARLIHGLSEEERAGRSLLAVYELDGSSTDIPCVEMHAIFFQSGDFNGDGVQDLVGSANTAPVLSDKPLYSYWIWSTNGRLLDSGTNPGNSFFWVSDIDADGEDELLCRTNQEAGDQQYSYLRLIEKGKWKEVTLPVENEAWLFESARPVFLDCDTDGVDELLIDNSIRELDGSHPVPLELLPNAKYMVTGDMLGDSAIGWQLGTEPVLVAMVDERCMWSDSLGIWDMQGRLLYCERFGEKLHSIAVVRDGGRQRLAVLTQSRLLISP